MSQNWKNSQIMKYSCTVAWAATCLISVQAAVVPNPVSESDTDLQGLKIRPESLQALRKQFDLLDVNKDSRISRSDLLAVLPENKTGIKPGMEAYLKGADRDRDEMIDFYEFLLISPELTLDDKFTILFRAYDKDKDGFLSKEDLREILKWDRPDFTEETLFETFTVMDKNNNGKVTCADFVTSFKASSKLKVQIGKYKGFKTNPDKLSGLILFFNTIDEDLDGQISKTELVTFLKKNNPSVFEDETRMGQFLQPFDFDKDENINLDEFLMGLAHELVMEDGFKILFRKYNKSNTGILSKGEMFEYLKKENKDTTQGVSDEAYKIFDNDKDGQVSCKDFVDTLSRMVKEKQKQIDEERRRQQLKQEIEEQKAAQKQDLLVTT